MVICNFINDIKGLLVAIFEKQYYSPSTLELSFTCCFTC
jgi:hypothetical protein